MAIPVLTVAQVISDNSIFRTPHIIAFNRLEARPPHARLHPQLARRSPGSVMDADATMAIRGNSG